VEHSRLLLLNVDGSDQTQVTFPDDPNAPDANNANWSPDGGKITFCGGFAHGDGYIFTINPDGSDRTQLTFVPSDDPAWSPDSQQMIYDAVGSDALARRCAPAQPRATRTLLPMMVSNTTIRTWVSFCLPGRPSSAISLRSRFVPDRFMTTPRSPS
jgi:Tol biopolymer transport system component